MILVADSGSTKCSWVLYTNTEEKLQYCKTIGFNPFFIDRAQIIKHLQKSDLVTIVDKITEVHFYGAGCSNSQMKNKLKEDLGMFFESATINVKHDLDSACIATFKGKSNICCILGTGSNSCFFDGNKILEAAPSLGYIVGDEASGNYFGKKVLQLYFNNKLSEDLRRDLENEYGLTLEGYYQNVYHSEQANKYLARFFRFLADNKSEIVFQEIIQNGLREFFELHICCFKNYKNHPINFVGSVAYFLADEIKEMAKEFDCTIEQIIRNPIDNLVQYHLQKIN